METKKSIKNRKTITFICDYCKHEGIKSLSEYNRNIKLGRKNYCCRECAAKGAGQTRTNLPREVSDNMLKHNRSISNNRKDEYTPFRYTLRNINKRFKNVNITLSYLKTVWENQKGICPYTGLQLVLPIESNLSTIPFPYRASLDRIDSNLGYIEGNVQFVSTPINLMKSTMTDLETKQYLKLISSYTSTFVEDKTISSSQNEMSDALAGN